MKKKWYNEPHCVFNKLLEPIIRNYIWLVSSEYMAFHRASGFLHSNTAVGSKHEPLGNAYKYPTPSTQPIRSSHQLPISQFHLAKYANELIMPQVLTNVPHVNINEKGTITMHMKNHVNSTVKSCNFQLRTIGKIRQYLPSDAASNLIHVFISSRLDYGNSFLYGLPESFKT